MDGINVNVDGTEFYVFESFSFDTSYYLQNFNRTGLRYEVSFSSDGNIVWVNRPFKSVLTTTYIFSV